MSAADEGHYRLTIKPSAPRDLKKLKNNPLVLKSVRATISELRREPRPFGVKHLGGMSYRVRDGEYRILYDIDDDRRLVDIKRVRDRKEVYKHK